MELRPLKKEEYDQLRKFLYYAIYVPPGQEAPDHSIIEQQVLNKYHEAFGQARDESLAAIVNEEIVGLVWCRQFRKEQESYGYYRDDFVELNISVLPDYRGAGIGTSLLKKMIAEVRSKGIKGISLSVTNGNPAQKLYQSLGFKVIETRTEDSLMALCFEETNA
ncbi:GNAT family N-acetyltransferase [Facklamia sp. DSM 111018]|uniref:GNAT family N-acetyltransferase n=1 Tax=Facklamia lactis TaxID=2749967 RepID=A0ABS0LT45_9LACT|nr:GNAT family N-acetyltransferase [Facklamia lactis]MBG9979461.1 GNAT family N-acetyltransferase [Facklamia lactis]MBG9987326.1 GNAT family N-acetyltransferase [Facklamia lactis]